MRKLNEKIYEIAGVDPSSGRTLIDKQEEVDVNQLLTETFFDESQAGIVEDNTEQEAQEVLKSDYDKVYGKAKEQAPSLTKEKSAVKKPKTQPKKAVSQKTEIKKNISKTESSNNNFQLIIFIIALGAIAFYYFFIK